MYLLNECALFDEGDTASDVWTDHDYKPDGVTISRIRVGGLDFEGVTATGRTTLKSASTGTDSAVRSALVSVLGAGAGRVWDDAPNQDQLHGPYVTGYVGVRNRIRSMMAELP